MPGYHDPIKYPLSTFSFDAIEDYFSQLNPIARRIAFDISDTKANYGKLWNTLDYHEQNDIINDTLIKPEISLRYFDNFLTPTPTNSTCHSFQSSTDSLTAIVLKDVNPGRGSTKDQDDRGKKNCVPLRSNGVKKISSHNIKSFYSFDGSNLNTFAIQKVALKVIQDEALGCFRDEHSRPFSYRTKSQIDLFVLQSIPGPMAAALKVTALCKNVSANLKPAASEVAAPDYEESKNALDNYHRLQNQLKTNLHENQFQDSYNSSLFATSVKSSSISASRKIFKSPEAASKQENKGLSVLRNTKSSVLQNYINSTQLNASSKMSLNHAVFSDYNTAEESSNLLQNDPIMGSCSSAATSDDDDKTLEENVHLLDNDSTIRKGFDFLNNW